MTVDEENSIYVGGLPYDCSEDTLRRAFDLYGAVVAVKIINDREVGGRCYGFVTFTNPRSAVDAIMDMNGRTIGGRAVRVNEVRTRGGKPNFHRENFRRDSGRDNDWDRDRERDNFRDRDRNRDRFTERSRDRDREREREYERGRDFDRARDHAFDRRRDREDDDQEHIRDRDRDWERDNDMEWDRDRELDKNEDHDGGRDKDMEHQSRSRIGSARLNDRRSRELSSNSADDYNYQVKEQLEISVQRHEELEKELIRIEEKVKEKEQLVSDMQRKSQKLEDAVATAKKLSSQRQSMLTKLHKCFLQTQEYAETVRSAEQELQSIVDVAMAEVDVGEDAGARDGSIYANVQV